jgi:uroporphyrinogen decarboxylase
LSAGKFLATLAGMHFPTPPIWLMRQAGRYLPEYRALRDTARSFLDFCYTPDKAVEATLQPIRRFDLDAAIIFSDILVVPDALGQKVWFEEGEGPKLEPLTDPAQFGRLSRGRLVEHLAPVYRAIEATRASLSRERALLGFAGAPFTLACYMIEGGGSRDFIKTKLWAYRHPESFSLLIDLLVEAVVDHLALQVEAGADAVQLFDSWAGILPEEQLFAWSLEPMVRIAQALKTRHPAVPVIAFPRAVGPAALM